MPSVKAISMKAETAAMAANPVKFRSRIPKYASSTKADLLRLKIKRNRLDRFHPRKNASAIKTIATNVPTLPTAVEPRPFKS